jgi:hypothetical protein
MTADRQGMRQLELTPRTFSPTVRALVLAGIIVALVGLTVSDHRNLRALGLLPSQGSVNVGAMYGVQIGSEVSEGARQFHRQGYRVFASPDLSARSCGGRRLNTDELVHVYEDRSWRGGTLCLFERRGRIVALAWSYCMMCP